MCNRKRKIFLSEKTVETYLNATYSNYEEQLNHKESCQEIHKDRTRQAP